MKFRSSGSGYGDRKLEVARGCWLDDDRAVRGRLGLGEIDGAFECDRAVEGDDQFIMPIKSYWFLDPIRSDPHFAALLRKMRLDD